MFIPALMIAHHIATAGAVTTGPLPAKVIF